MKAPSLITILVLFAFAKDVWCRQSADFYQSRYEERIVGGYGDTVQNNPYIVHLHLEDVYKKYTQCGGTILNQNYILTAAHCMIGIVKVIITAGSSKVNSGGVLYTSAQIIPHPSYNSFTNDHDVAIIRTATPIRLDGINTKAVRLPNQEYDVRSGTNINVSGWGATREDGSAITSLMSVVVQTLSSGFCSQQLGYSITTCQFCAGVPEGGRDSCKGDSGGPAVLAQSRDQVGIVSYGTGCGRPGNPGVYTRVACASIRSWIQRITGV